LNLDLCARQTKIWTNIPETKYTKKVLEATEMARQKPGT